MKELLFRADGTFKIMQLTDIHYEDGSKEDQNTLSLMERLLQRETPDFIMITGDTVYGVDNVENLSKALRPVIDSKIPWSLVFGNHDTELGKGYEELFSEVQKLPGCIAYHEEESGSGVGNHVIRIIGTDGTLKWALMALDSGNYNKVTEIGGYDYIKRSQTEWYVKKIKQLEEENPEFAALAFFHIALREHREVWNYEVCYGEKNEGVCCSRVNSGLFLAMLEAGHTKGVFVGHDHINDYYGVLHGITLGYGRAAGYNTYGKDGYQRGARIFILHEMNPYEFDTYERLEDGSLLQNPKKHLPERMWEEE